MTSRSHRAIWIALALINAAAVCALFLRGGWLLGPDGQPLPHDFLDHWAAGLRAWQGKAELAYDWNTHVRFQTDLLEASKPIELPFFHPPHFLFVALPFARLDYIPATLAFLAVTGLLYAAVLRGIVRDWVLALAMAFSVGGAMYTIRWSQIGFLTASLLVGGLALLPRRPVLAGILFGCLTIKPQMGLVLALALLLSREWRAIASAVVTTLVLVLASELAFGPGIWATFLENADGASAFLWSGNIWFKMQSVFALTFPIAGPVGAAAIHALAAAVALAIFVWVWRSGAPYGSRAAALIVTTLIVTPYVFSYDAVMLTGAAAFLLHGRGRLAGWERLCVIFACVIPSAYELVFSGAVPLGAFLMLYVVARNVSAPSHAGEAAAPIRV